MTTHSLQRLDWDGAVNAWQIRPGFFRMGRAEALTSRGWDQMVDAGVVKDGLDLSKAYTTEYVCKGVGMDLRPQ